MSTLDSPELAVLIPAWNEAQNLEALLPALREVIAALGLKPEIIVIDAGSSDGTAQVAARQGARLILQTERGYGGALLAGFAAARAPYLVTMDADLSHRPIFIEELWKHRAEAEVLIASRYVPGGCSQTHWFRRLLSLILNETYRRILALPVRDLSSGFRMYRRDVVAALRPVARDYDILEEILIRIHKQGSRIREVPFCFMPRGTGRSHVRLLHFGWAYLKTLYRMWRLGRVRIPPAA
jgi:dolichol-phosphate mannosyltransferase